MKKLTAIFLIVCLLITEQLGFSEEFILKVYLPNLIKSAEVKYELPLGLLSALIEVESAGRIKAINHDDGNYQTKSKGFKVKSHGLVQMQLGTAKMIQIEKYKALGIKLNKKDVITSKKLMEPETNIEYGAMYLKWLLVNHDNDISWALTCYNSGPYSRMCKNKVYYGRYVGKILNKLINTK